MRKLFNDRSGAAAVEYAEITGLAVFLMMFMLNVMGTSVVSNVTQTTAAIASKMTSDGGGRKSDHCR